MGNHYTEYDYTYHQTSEFEDIGDVKAIIFIDSYPVNAEGEQVAEGYVVAQVILSTHNDKIVAWSSSAERLNPKVLELIEKAKIEIEEYM